jgi:hypothetical protein
MRRLLLNLAATLSLLLCIAVACAWAAGSRRPRVWGWSGETVSLAVYADGSGLAVRWLDTKPEYRARAAHPVGSTATRIETPTGFTSAESVGMRSPFDTPEGWERWNFGYASLAFPANHQWWVLVPSWLPLLATMLAPAAWVGKRLRGRRAAGHCQQCGYDLTANASGRCPECGAAAEAARVHR